ncbi:MAG: response regulator, partial [Myxococcales bacterium]|nr:response regulator [Myxococcales bacterium]
MRILLIEDDEKLAERTAEYLQSHKATVEIVGDGERGLERAAAGEHDIVLLDLMLPGIDGLELCRRLRQRSKVPVIILSARGEEVDRIVGLEVG